MTDANAVAEGPKIGAASLDVSLISIVVPVLNEQDAIRPFAEKLSEVFEGLEGSIEYEILFVNDGSTDATEIAIRGLMVEDPKVGLINLSRNFGKDAALSAGLDHARGDAAIPIDVDLQDPPELIPQMIEAWQDGAKIVNARRVARSEDGWAKRATARAFYKTFNAVADRPIPVDVGDFRLLDRQVLDVVTSLGERARFNKALFSWVGFETAEVTYSRPARTTGSSAWTYWKLWNFALDGIFTSSTAPLRMWSYLGLILAISSFFYAGFIFFYALFAGTDTPGYASTVILILAFGGLNLIALGILGEYVGRIYSEVRSRPLYIVRSVHRETQDED